MDSQEIRLQHGDKQRRNITTDDRWVALYNYILSKMNAELLQREDIIINISIYRHLTACTDYTARKELELFEKESKLKRIPSGRTKLYVLSV